MKKEPYFDPDFLNTFAATNGISGAAVAEWYRIDDEYTAWYISVDLLPIRLAEMVSRYLMKHGLVDMYEAWINNGGKTA